MLKSSKTSFLLLSLSGLLFTTGCKRAEKKTFSQDPAGYWWQLIAFTNDAPDPKTGRIAWINAVFKTQGDSVFYDSKYDTRDRLFIKTGTAQGKMLNQLVSRSTEGDSICMLINPDIFFSEQFNSSKPAFCRRDSVVKVFFRIKRLLGQDDYIRLTKEIANNEQKEIEAFFGSVQKMEESRDTLGFYWVEKPGMDEAGEVVKYGDLISISYEGAFLNGRIVDISPGNFVLHYGTPDQLVKGLNYVIGCLKIGQNSKIILPSHLAFGENGSTNGSIPPFTPMLYKISIKKQNF
jgi:hypothetical protein